MPGQKKTKKELLDELQTLRERVLELEKIESEISPVRQALRDSEVRFQLFLDNSPCVAFIKDRDGRHLYVNQTFLRVFQTTPGNILGKTPFDQFSPAIARELQENDALVFRENKPLQLTENVPTPDGEPHSWLVIKFPFHDPAGKLLLGGVAVDVSERMRAEERLQTLSRLLMDAQESERRHIAGELHDEIGQILTALKLALETSARNAPEIFHSHLARPHSLVLELMERTRGLSLRLRPSMLDDLGLLPALHWFCQRYEAFCGIKVALRHAGLDGRRLAPEVETAAYRIVQEALTNVARHAGVQEAAVNLRADDRLVSLLIEDRGKGFDPEEALARKNSCGLAGMRERVHLLGGKIHFLAKPGKGTRLNAELPLRSDRSDPFFQ